MSGSFRLGVDIAGLSRALGAAAVHCEEAARPAAQAMAQVLYDDVRARVQRTSFKTGRLLGAIYQAFSPENSATGVAVYHVSWNERKAPHGHLVEFGHVMTHATYYDEQRQRWVTDKRKPIAPRHVAAQPFVRPAVAAFPAARKAGVDRYALELQKRGVAS